MDKNDYSEITVRVNKEISGVLGNFLIEQGCGGFVCEELEPGQSVELKVYHYNLVEAQALASRVSNYLKSLKKMDLDVGQEMIKIKKVRKKDWEKFWKRDIKPLQIGEKIVVKPSWDSNEFPDKIVIKIDPKMAFGTGRHETTQMCMREIENLIQPGDRVLDVGTGSGILAILAAKLGASHVLAIDTDRIAIDSASENIEKNSLKDVVKVKVGTVDKKIPGKSFDLVVANLFKSRILELFEKIQKTAKEDATIILSGILDSERDEISGFLEEKKTKIERVTQDAGWLCFVVR